MITWTHVAGENFVMFTLRFFLKLIHLFFLLSLWATRGARTPNLQVVITHASRVCSQHSFGLPLRMNGMHRTQFDRAPLDILSLVIWSRVLTICHVKLTQSAAMEQKRKKRLIAGYRSLSPALRNLLLLLVCIIKWEHKLISFLSPCFVVVLLCTVCSCTWRYVC